MSTCCISGFEWNGKPTGVEGTLGDNKAYITGLGLESDIVIMVIHDLFGWTFTNLRLLCDRYAMETEGSVYMSDLWVLFLLIIPPNVVGSMTSGIVF
jgi:hypothetical protein